MDTWIILGIIAFWFALDMAKEKKGGWWAEAHYLAHTAAMALLAVVLTIQVWTGGIDNRWIMGILTFIMLRGAWEFWQDEHRKREARHINARMQQAFLQERKRNPDFMKGFELTDNGLIYQEGIKDGSDDA